MSRTRIVNTFRELRRRKRAELTKLTRDIQRLRDRRDVVLAEIAALQEDEDQVEAELPANGPG